MRLPALPRSISSCLFLIASSNALRVAPTSPCLSVCGDATITNGSDIVCDDADFTNTATGRAFQECISCELNSTAYDTVNGQTDLQWLLYNLRYELSWCVWGFPNATGIGNTPCVTGFACEIFKDSIESDNLSPNASTFGYCNGFNTEYIGQCQNCLRELTSELYLSNFFTVLQAGCSQQPFNGETLSLSGPLFSTSSIQIINASSPISTWHASASGPLNLGAKVGIAVGAIVFILILTGCFIVCRGKRRRRAFLAAQHHIKRHNQNMMYTPTMEQQGQRHTPSPPMQPPTLQTQHFQWQRPDKYPTNSPDDAYGSSVSGSGNEKFFSQGNYSSLYSSPVSGGSERDGPGSAVTMNQVHPWIAGGLGDGQGHRDGMHMGRMGVVREHSGDDIELQRMEPKVDLGDFIGEAGVRGFTTSPVRGTVHREGMI